MIATSSSSEPPRKCLPVKIPTSESSSEASSNETLVVHHVGSAARGPGDRRRSRYCHAGRLQARPSRESFRQALRSRRLSEGGKRITGGGHGHSSRPARRHGKENRV